LSIGPPKKDQGHGKKTAKMEEEKRKARGVIVIYCFFIMRSNQIKKIAQL